LAHPDSCVCAGGWLGDAQKQSLRSSASSLRLTASRRDVSAVHPRIQLLQERNEAGLSMIDTANDVIEAATKRCYSDAREPFFRVTVTDYFGGRGHDFDCMDERANAHGGMLVIATSVPDAREWIQWKGRTARQDRPGQYFVALSAEEEPFASEPGLAETLGRYVGAGTPDRVVEELLRRKDEGIHEALGSFEAQQARGAWQNELCERYYRERPRAHDEPWPSTKWRKTDVKLREMLGIPFGTGNKIREAASSRLGVELSGPPIGWGWGAGTSFGIEPKRQEMAVVFLIDRTFEAFLQKVVDAVVSVYDKYLEPDDLVGYYGLGDGWIFEAQRKGDNDAALRQQIVGSVQKAGEPHVYSSINKCVDYLSGGIDHTRAAKGEYSKWLVVLTDTADFECVNEKNQFDAQSPKRCEDAVSKTVAKMKAVHGLNLVIIDASGIANFDPKQKLWPTWHRMSTRLTDEVGDGNTGLNIEAANVDEIDEAFEKVAGAMASGGASG